MSNQNGHQGGQEFPCASLAKALPHLRRPPTPQAVRFKLLTVVGEAAQIVPYVDARLVFDRLDLVCGECWSTVFEPLPEPLRSRTVDRNGEVVVPSLDVRCLLTVFGVTRQDVGVGDDPKAAFSDSVKRAAVHFGIARALYALGAPWLREGADDGELRRNPKGRLIIDARTEAWLRGGYQRWLDQRGRSAFGQPLDHGDETGAAGFEAQGQEPDIQVVPTAGSQKHGEEVQADTHPQASSPGHAARGLAVSARLVAVTDGSPGDPPATALDRRKIAHWVQAGHYQDDTIASLAGLVCGERIVERLTHEQVGELAALLESAVRGRVTQADLADLVTRLESLDGERSAAVRLRRQLQQQANAADRPKAA